MSAESFNTLVLQNLVEQFQQGNAEAFSDLIHQVGERLEHLAQKMLRQSPVVRRWEQADDLCQNTQVRLWRRLKEHKPESIRDFFRMAAVEMNRELISLARKHRGVQGFAHNHDSVMPTAGEEAAQNPRLDPAAPQAGVDDLERWALFHEVIEELPIELREVVGLTYYHRWTQSQIAELLQIDERTVRRRWQQACLKIADRLGGELPEM